MLSGENAELLFEAELKAAKAKKELKAKKERLIQARLEGITSCDLLKKTLKEQESEVSNIEHEIGEIQRKVIIDDNCTNDHAKKILANTKKLSKLFEKKMAISYVHVTYDIYDEVHIKFSEIRMFVPLCRSKITGRFFRDENNAHFECQDAIDFLKNFPHQEWHEVDFSRYTNGKSYKVVTISSKTLDSVIAKLEQMRDLSESQIKQHEDGIYTPTNNR